VDAIKPDSQDAPDGKWLKVNTEFAKVWPNITRKGTPPADADQFKDEKDKYEKYFSPEPGDGN
jgi:ferredoxin